MTHTLLILKTIVFLFLFRIIIDVYASVDPSRPVDRVIVIAFYFCFNKS